MMRLVRTLGAGLLVGLCTLSVKASADNWCWDSCRWDGCWEVGAEALYWKPCACGWEYGLRQDTLSDSKKYLTIGADYDWGFRILGAYYSCDACTFLQLDWTYLRSTDRAKVTAGANESLIIDNFLLAVGATPHLRFQYNRVNLRGGYFLYRGCDLSFYALGGVRWFDIKERRGANVGTTQQTEGPILARSQVWGVGIELGFGVEYDIACGFSLVGHVAGTAAVGERSYNFRSQVPPTATFSFIEAVPNDTTCVPGFDFRLGFAYSYDCACVALTGEIGYESNYYFGALTTQHRGPLGTTTSCNDVGFAGPYLSLKVRF